MRRLFSAISLGVRQDLLFKKYVRTYFFCCSRFKPPASKRERSESGISTSSVFIRIFQFFSSEFLSKNSFVIPKGIFIVKGAFQYLNQSP